MKRGRGAVNNGKSGLRAAPGVARRLFPWSRSTCSLAPSHADTETSQAAFSSLLRLITLAVVITDSPGPRGGAVP